MDCSLPGSSVQGIFQARVLEWGAIAFSYSSSFPYIIRLLGTLRSLLMWVKEKRKKKTGLKLNVNKKLRLWHLVLSLHGKYKGINGSSDRFSFLGL